jgi:krueppel-like factor 5
MNRLNKLDTDVELEIHPNQQQHTGSAAVYGSYENYGAVKEYYCGTTKREICADNDDQFLRPPLWEDITSSIQNIDPENAIMLSALTGATQVKLESSDDTFLESLSSPLLSPLEIKTEKGFYQHQPNHNNNSIHLQQSHHQIHAGGDSYSVQHYHQTNSNPQVHHSSQLNGYQDFGMHHQPQQFSNNYYNWQQNHPQSHQPPVYANKYVPQCAPPISRLMYVPPLTPPSSDPGSPGNSAQVSFRSTIATFTDVSPSTASATNTASALPHPAATPHAQHDNSPRGQSVIAAPSATEPNALHPIQCSVKRQQQQLEQREKRKQKQQSK